MSYSTVLVTRASFSFPNLQRQEAQTHVTACDKGASLVTRVKGSDDREGKHCFMYIWTHRRRSDCCAVVTLPWTLFTLQCGCYVSCCASYESVVSFVSFGNTLHTQQELKSLARGSDVPVSAANHSESVIVNVVCVCVWVSEARSSWRAGQAEINIKTSWGKAAWDVMSQMFSWNHWKPSGPCAHVLHMVSHMFGR